MADVRVRHDFESERGEWLIVRGTPQFRLFGVGRNPLDGQNVGRRRQIIHNRVEQGLYALIFERRACQNGDELQSQRRAAHRSAQLRRLELMFGKIFREHGVIVLGNVLDDLFAMLFVKLRTDGRGFDCRGDIRARLLKRRIPELLEGNVFEFRAESFVLPDNGALLDEVDDADESVFLAEGKLEGNGVGREALAHGANHVVEIGAGTVHLIHKGDARDAILVGLTPNRFRLRLHTRDRIKNRDGPVEDAKGTFDFNGEIDVAGRVNDIDAIVGAKALPGGRGGGGSDSDAALALLLHPIHRGRAFVDAADFVRDAGIEEDAFGRGRLAGVNVRHDPEIAHAFELELPSHEICFRLPAVMGEGFIRVRHAMHVLFLFYRATLAIGRVHQFVGQLVGHIFARALTGVQDDPVNSERLAPELIHFDRHLIVRAADAPRLHFEQRLHIFDRLLENRQGVAAFGLLRDVFHRLIENRLSGGALAVVHHAGDKLLYQIAAVDRDSDKFPANNKTLAWHSAILLLLSGFRPFRAVFRARLLAVLDASGIERPANYVIANSRQILHATAAHEHDRVLLQIVADAGDVRGDFGGIGEASARDLAQSRVGLLRRLRIDADANSALLRAALERGRLRLCPQLLAAMSNQLRKRRHYSPPKVTRISHFPPSVRGSTDGGRTERAG